ncbi:hypothetical protein [Companilactobacillus mishanensis]|uniref:Uncharacterized protein n=1 Tax=Companilactobacillus mishanensis TaxID=2486008 RepID=A0A5P0ZFP3_9LACO|nr:hypothetical protein [Companilactobacillus mishanensis]MQS45619.1 hypothetical protein [Companilactobacillus mishanensis]MQS51866.1 hypothetical protein [Companilactobacillus mishanensis]MQS89019.1 hypothetical protein [Companilactobacillus mishanensis]
MNITLKLGTYNFLKNQLTSADTLLKPLFDSKADHLLIKELATSGEYRNIKGDIDSSKNLYLLVYIKLNNEQISIFEDKVFYKFKEFVIENDEPAIFQNREDYREYLLVNSFSKDAELSDWKYLIMKKLKDGLQKSSQEPLGFFQKAYIKAN